MVGRAEEAIADLEHAVRLSPRDPNVWSFQIVGAWAHALGVDDKSALAWAEEAARHPNGNFWTHLRVAASSEVLGHHDVARRALEGARAAKGDLTLGYIAQTLPFETDRVRDRVFGITRRQGLLD
jgi:hypothetical protein